MSLSTSAKLFLCCLSGFLLSLSAPGFEMWFLAWISLSPLFIIINTSRKIKGTIAYTFLFGFTYNISYLHWLLSLHPLDWLSFSKIQSLLISTLALVVPAVGSTLPFVLFAICIFYIKRISYNPYNKGIANVFLTTILWLAIFNKLASTKLLFGFPWTLVEYSQYKNLFLIQIAEYLGSAFISFLIVFFNLVLAELIIWILNIEKLGDRYVRREATQLGTITLEFSFILSLISLSLIFGMFSYWKHQQYFSKKSKSICILQGNLPIKATRGKKLDLGLAKSTYNELINNIDSSLIIIPEGSLPTISNSNPTTQSYLKNLGNKKQADIVIGSICKEPKEEKPTNCAVHYSLEKDNFSFYEKERLVPFGEFIPFLNFLPSSVNNFITTRLGDGFKEGKYNLPIDTSCGKVGVNICFELIFPTIIRKHSLQGARLLVNLSDLSWFSNDLVKQQFLAFGVFRAIENRKPLIIASNNGTSAFIEPNGKIKNQSLPNTRGVLMDFANPTRNVTFYAKFGW